jgi:S-adenosylmethionine/arginine decarboxylase-like enzyme
MLGYERGCEDRDKMQLLMDGYCDQHAIAAGRGVPAEPAGRVPVAASTLTRITEPFIIRYEDCHRRSGAFRVFVFLAESHIAIHTHSFRERGFVEHRRVFLLQRPFDTEHAAEDLRRGFDFKEWRVALAEREWVLTLHSQGTENPTLLQLPCAHEGEALQTAPRTFARS